MRRESLAEFTGERLIPGQVDVDLLNEHLARYAFAARLAQGKRVLDLGCGAGYGSAELAKTAHWVTGVDIAAEAVDYARAAYRLPNLRFHTRLDEKAACGIATVGIDGVQPEALQAHLFADYRILTVAIAHDRVQGIRVTPNVYTTLAELDRFVDVMEQIARHGLPR